MNSTIIHHYNEMDLMWDTIKARGLELGGKANAARQMALWYAYQLHGVNYVQSDEEAVDCATRGVVWALTHGLFVSREVQDFWDNIVPGTL